MRARKSSLERSRLISPSQSLRAGSVLPAPLARIAAATRSRRSVRCAPGSLTDRSMPRCSPQGAPDRPEAAFEPPPPWRRCRLAQVPASALDGLAPGGCSPIGRLDCSFKMVAMRALLADARPLYCRLRPICVMSFSQNGISALMAAANSWGELPITPMPSVVSFPRTSAWASALTAS
jgi:hypothetical protein